MLIFTLIAMGIYVAGDDAGKVNILVRLFVELLGVGAFYLWARDFRTLSKSGSRMLSIIGTAILVIFLVIEIEPQWTAFSLMLGALFLLLLGEFLQKRLKDNIFFIDSYLLYIAAIICYPIIALLYSHETLALFSADWWGSVSAIIAGAGYIALVYYRGRREGEPEWKAGAIYRYRSKSLFIPFFVSMALYFPLVAGGAVLTTLYLLMMAALYVLALFLRERIFRWSSYGLLGFSVLRLITTDIADPIDRAAVFIIAGVVLLGMNWMYHRVVLYQERQNLSANDPGIDDEQ